MYQEEQCCYFEECRNKDNARKCFHCENNPFNFPQLEEQEFNGVVHDRKNRKFYNFQDNYESV